MHHRRPHRHSTPATLWACPGSVRGDVGTPLAFGREPRDAAALRMAQTGRPRKSRLSRRRNRPLRKDPQASSNRGKNRQIGFGTDPATTRQVWNRRRKRQRKIAVLVSVQQPVKSTTLQQHRIDPDASAFAAAGKNKAQLLDAAVRACDHAARNTVLTAFVSPCLALYRTSRTG